MFLINTTIGPSPVHGLGTFAGVAIPAGTVVYRHEPPEFFQSYPEEAFQRLSPETRAFICHYGFWKDGYWHIHLDDIRFLNDNPATPNLTYKEGEGLVALRDITVGEELTQDYAECADLDWLQQKRATYGEKK